MPWGVAAAVVGGAIANKTSKDASKAAAAQNQAQIEANAVDPRITEMLLGNGESGGVLERYRGLLDQPQSASMQQAGSDASNYLTQHGATDMSIMRDGAKGLLSGLTAPQMGTPQMGAPQMGLLSELTAPQMVAPQAAGTSLGTPAWAVGNMVNAPKQNNIDLSKSYDGFVNGERGANPYLTGAIGKGINQSQNAFQRMQDDSTRNLMEAIMPSIRSNSVLAGQYGGSRQGIAEGRALGDFAREQQRAISQFGQNNTDAAVSAQAGGYDADSNRALSATQGLGAQQYGVAQQDAATRNAAEFMNVNQVNDTNKTWASLDQQKNLANMGAQLQTNSQNLGAQLQTNSQNMGAQLQTNSQNMGAQLQTNSQNLGAQLQTNSQNMGAQLQTNSQNSQNAATGAGLLGGLLGTAYGQAGAQDQYGITRAGQVNGLLQPYLSRNPVPTQLQSTYSNTAGSALGGATAGLGLYNMYQQANKPQYGTGPTNQNPWPN